MKFKLIFAPLLFIITNASDVNSASCGTPLGPPYRNVFALSNGDASLGDSCRDEYGDYGYEYQCVEYIRRFYSEALGADTRKSNGWWGNAKDYYASSAEKGLEKFSNGNTTTKPRPDDILVFGNSASNSFGHVAIVENVAGPWVFVVEQNWSKTGRARLSMSTNSDTRNLTVANRDGMPVLGWLRKIGINYVDPPDLTPNLTIPDYLGTVDNGLNKVIGSIDTSKADSADSFSFRVPDGLKVTQIELVITNFSSDDPYPLAGIRSFSGGTTGHYVSDSTVITNLVNVSGGLTAGEYDLQIWAAEGNVALDYRFYITASTDD